jgi:hypothetical protein
MYRVYFVPALTLILGVIHIVSWRNFDVVSEKGPSFAMFSSTDTMKTRVITISDSATGKQLAIPTKLLGQFEVARAFPSQSSLLRVTTAAACELKLKQPIDGKFWKLDLVQPDRLESEGVLEVKGVRCSTNG